MAYYSRRFYNVLISVINVSNFSIFIHPNITQIEFDYVNNLMKTTQNKLLSISFIIVLEIDVKRFEKYNFIRPKIKSIYQNTIILIM